MNVPSITRRKTAFVPWLACLIIGATAHAGWLIHELRETQPLRVDVHVDGPERGGRLHHEPRAIDAGDELADLDLWVYERRRYTYTVDRRVLDRIATAGLLDIGVIDGDALALERDAWVQGIGRGQPIELRNIRSGTPMHLLGLR
ncbi:MAG: hypothetical protein KC431_05805, partial [Myxococcales bacterium]|nr:hypothetical protein [Myxococcales bacterium]